MRSENGRKNSEIDDSKWNIFYVMTWKVVVSTTTHENVYNV